MEVNKKTITLFITEDGSHSLHVPELDETYHSSHGAIQESRHVFIKHGLDYWLSKNGNKQLSVYEVGFGTGLNALLSLQKAEQLNLQLNYTSIELYPLATELTDQLNYAKEIGVDNSIFKKLHSVEWNKKIAISSFFSLCKLEASFKENLLNTTFDIIYYDAFAPSKQPEMWDYALIEKCYNILNPNGVFVTYSAKGQLKRDLKTAGFMVESLAGPPGKFEMVRAVKEI